MVGDKKAHEKWAKETEGMNIVDFLRAFQAKWQEAYDKYEKALKKHDKTKRLKL